MHLTIRHLKVMLPVLVLLLFTFFIGCTDENPTTPAQPDTPDVPDDTDVLRAPNTAQMTLDIPSSMATEASRSEDGPDCDNLDFPGPVFVCVTKFTLGEMAVGMVDEMAAMMSEIMTGIAEGNLAAGETHVMTNTEDDMVISILWEDGAETDEFHLALTGATSGNLMADWDWEIDSDGAASGVFQLTNELMEEDHGDESAGGLYLEFSSNATGSEKSVFIDLEMEEPTEEDLSAPTSLRLSATKDADGWTLQYGMYHPYWFGETIENSVASYLLVTAICGLEDDDPGVMKVICMPATVSTVPADPDETYSICAFALDYSEDQGLDWIFECGDANPIYVEADGTITEGGDPPSGLESLAADLADMSYIVTDLTLIRDISITLDDAR